MKISDQLVNTDDSTAFETDNTTLSAHFPKKLKENHPITYQFGSHYLKFSHISALNGKENKNINPALKTENKDNQIIYQNIFPDINLRHVTMDHEVKEDWILNKYTGINQFQYTLNTDLIAHLDKDGSIGFYNDKQLSKKVFEYRHQ